MAELLSFAGYDITGTFKKGMSCAFHNGYLYTLDADGWIYRLNPVTKVGERVASITGFLSLRSYDTIMILNGSDDGNLYYVVAKSGDDNRYNLMGFDLETLTKTNLIVFEGYDIFSYSGYRYQRWYINADENIKAVWNQRTRSTTYEAGSGVSYLAHFGSDLTQQDEFRLNSQDLDRYTLQFPSILDNNGYHLVYGLEQNKRYVDYIGAIVPIQPYGVTLDNNEYSMVTSFRYGDSVYCVGGVKNSDPNTDIIKFNPDSFGSTLYGESNNDSASTPFAIVNNGIVYVIFSDSKMMIGTPQTYDIDYSFYNNAGEVQQTLEGKLPVTNVNVGFLENTVSVTLTYLDSSTQTVNYEIEELPEKQFIGLSFSPNSKRAQLPIGSNDVYIANDVSFYPVYVKYVVPSTTFDIDLYQCTAETNRVDKTNYLTQVGTLQGALREQCSIVNPSITYQSENVPNFNYVFISAFGRYYFVNSLTSVGKNLWRMDLSCDVLMTYQAEILQLTAIIGRQENDYNDDLVDSMVPTEKENSVTYQEISNSVLNTSLTGKDVYNYVLTVVE